jgi:hypothetical protein
VNPELPPSESEVRPDVSLEQRVLALEIQLKALQDIVREHFAAPDHQANPEPLRELQESVTRTSATHN